MESTPVITSCQMRRHHSRETLLVTPKKPAAVLWDHGSRGKDRRQPPRLRVAPSEHLGKKQAAQSCDIEETEPIRTSGLEEAPVRGDPGPSGHLSREAPTCARTPDPLLAPVR